MLREPTSKQTRYRKLQRSTMSANIYNFQTKLSSLPLSIECHARNITPKDTYLPLTKAYREYKQQQVEK